MQDAQDFQARIIEGEALRDSGKLESSLTLFRQIASEFPDHPVPHFKLGTVFARLKQFDHAEEAYREALRLDPLHPETGNNLAVLLIADGRWSEAEALLRRALAERIDYYEAHLNAADVLQKLGRYAEALYHARCASKIEPKLPAPLERCGSILNSLGRMHQSMNLLRSGEAYSSSYCAYWTTLAVALQSLGRHEEAEIAHTRAIALAEEKFLPRMNYLYFSNYLEIPRPSLWRRHLEFGRWVRQLLGPPQENFSDIKPDPNRRLRVGFVSGDFRLHSVSYFLPGALDRLDRTRFQTYAYSVSFYQDDVTAGLRPLFNVWRDASGLEHKDLYELIRKDKIDILVDLSGYTDDNRLMVFARRPAPIQVSYLGYPNTTGLDTMDYRLTDKIADPVGDGDEFHSETLWRLDRSFLCYTPSEKAPDVVMRDNLADSVVFGSFNNRAKYSDACLKAWAELLQRIPGSRIVLKSQGGNGDEAGRRELVERFSSLGVEADRVRVLARIGDKSEHLAAYSEIDIGLDTFPYNGTTTTCEALWMGVPVVVLKGDRHASRVGASILDAVGLGDLVAESAEEYLEIAEFLAHNTKARGELRASMRDRLQSSALLDRWTMGRALGDAFIDMWRRYCELRAKEFATFSGEDQQPEPMRLHLGGEQAREGWKIFNIAPGENVDFVGDIRDMSFLDDNCCSEIYASHVLEHLSQAEVLPVFNELHRLLAPGGKLYVSVPDLETLSWMFISPLLSAEARFAVMRIMFGGQTTPHDFHYFGFCFDFLVDMLRDAGFQSFEHVESFGLFQDCSDLSYAGHKISLNLIASR